MSGELNPCLRRLGVELPHGIDACFELIVGSSGDRRSSAASSKFVVDPAVRLAGMVMGY